MELRFRGDALHKVDSKGRVSIPSGFRRVLAAGDPELEPGSSTPPTMIAVLSANSESLDCYSLEGMDRLESRILRVADPVRRQKLLDLIPARSIDLQLDDNGRIVLSQKLRDALGISDQARMVGKLEFFQIWRPEVYDARQAAVLAEYAAEGGSLDLFSQIPGPEL
ncbi:cell division/cell wall cluster transcriptional repressor MraZ [Paroceanicella profunda]|uniref:Transcriptional regulator MraZ n=1 Tax=Paroceanicella profunda TaxID=2579971 RepID=A0A5B8FT59_9RHOB|nr:cell division/cell wall cluster transcriptional repressor MraZ [Paroceanicella profunda]QDL90514.1 cell division/cell wall cluster transcriptional repressor MraZ [Paroceanicella profunda]